VGARKIKAMSILEGTVQCEHLTFGEIYVVIHLFIHKLFLWKINNQSRPQKLIEKNKVYMKLEETILKNIKDLVKMDLVKCTMKMVQSTRNSGRII